jgi:hypothetical protein
MLPREMRSSNFSHANIGGSSSHLSPTHHGRAGLAFLESEANWKSLPYASGSEHVTRPPRGNNHPWLKEAVARKITSFNL